MDPQLVVLLAVIGTAIMSLACGFVLWIVSKLAETKPVTFLRCAGGYFLAFFVSGVVGFALRQTGAQQFGALIGFAAVAVAVQILVILSFLDGWHRREIAVLGTAVFLIGAITHALSIPAELAMIEMAHKIEARNNLKCMGVAMYSYHDSMGRFPPAASRTQMSATPLLSWRVAILPYIEEAPLWEQFHHDEPWDSPHNKGLLPRMPSIYKSTNRPHTPPYHTYYQVFVNSNQGSATQDRGCAIFSATPAELHRGPSDQALSDGWSQTILIAEGGEAVPWTKPDDIQFSVAGPLPRIGGEFDDGCNVVFADAMLQWIPRDTDESLLRALITGNGGEDVDLEELRSK